MVLSDDGRHSRFKRGEGILSALKCLSFQARFSFETPNFRAHCFRRQKRGLAFGLLNPNEHTEEHFTSAGARSRWMTRGQIK